MTEAQNAFYLPPPNLTNRPEDVVNRVAYFAQQAGVVEPTRADYARAGYWAAVGRTNDARVLNGMCPIGMEATWTKSAASQETSLARSTYETCVLGSTSECTRWSHDHLPSPSEGGSGDA
jgi:hypothetical protein